MENIYKHTHVHTHTHTSSSVFVRGSESRTLVPLAETMPFYLTITHSWDSDTIVHYTYILIMHTILTPDSVLVSPLYS